MEIQENPCLNCLETPCCSLKGNCGLRLTQKEYENHFKEYHSILNVRFEGGFVIISSKEDYMCPNSGEDGCRIYENRPLDCRFYPMQILPVYETRKRAKIHLLMEHRCIKEKYFNMSSRDLMTQAKKLAKEVYGDKHVVIRIYDRRMMSKILSKIETWIIKIFARMRFC